MSSLPLELQRGARRNFAADADDDDDDTFALEMPPRKRTFLIGVCGGTASGKTTVCERIMDKLNDHRVVIISMDCFYKGLTEEQIASVGEYNFDHPDAFDFESIIHTLRQIVSRGGFAEVPKYDFKTHQRVPNDTQKIRGAEVIIFEGIMAFHRQDLRDLFDMKIFVDTDADIRLVRRIRRDIAERGRTVNSVLYQYEKFVKPAYDDHISPTKQYADVIVPRGGDNEVAIDLIAQHIHTRLERSGQAFKFAQHSQRASFMDS